MEILLNAYRWNLLIDKRQLKYTKFWEYKKLMQSIFDKIQGKFVESDSINASHVWEALTLKSKREKLKRNYKLERMSHISYYFNY